MPPLPPDDRDNQGGEFSFSSLLANISPTRPSNSDSHNSLSSSFQDSRTKLNSELEEIRKKQLAKSWKDQYDVTSERTSEVDNPQTTTALSPNSPSVPPQGTSTITPESWQQQQTTLHKQTRLQKHQHAKTLHTYSGNVCDDILKRSSFNESNLKREMRRKQKESASLLHSYRANVDDLRHSAVHVKKKDGIGGGGVVVLASVNSAEDEATAEAIDCDERDLEGVLGGMDVQMEGNVEKNANLFVGEDGVIGPRPDASASPTRGMAVNVTGYDIDDDGEVLTPPTSPGHVATIANNFTLSGLRPQLPEAPISPYSVSWSDKGVEVVPVDSASANTDEAEGVEDDDPKEQEQEQAQGFKFFGGPVAQPTEDASREVFDSKTQEEKPNTDLDGSDGSLVAMPEHATNTANDEKSHGETNKDGWIVIGDESEPVTTTTTTNKKPPLAPLQDTAPQPFAESQRESSPSLREGDLTSRQAVATNTPLSNTSPISAETPTLSPANSHDGTELSRPSLTNNVDHFHFATDSGTTSPPKPMQPVPDTPATLTADKLIHPPPMPAATKQTIHDTTMTESPIKALNPAPILTNSNQSHHTHKEPITAPQLSAPSATNNKSLQQKTQSALPPPPTDPTHTPTTTRFDVEFSFALLTSSPPTPATSPSSMLSTPKSTSSSDEQLMNQHVRVAGPIVQRGLERREVKVMYVGNPFDGDVEEIDCLVYDERFEAYLLGVSVDNSYKQPKHQNKQTKTVRKMVQAAIPIFVHKKNGSFIMDQSAVSQRVKEVILEILRNAVKDGTFAKEAKKAYASTNQSFFG